MKTIILADMLNIISKGTQVELWDAKDLHRTIGVYDKEEIPRTLWNKIIEELVDAGDGHVTLSIWK